MEVVPGTAAQPTSTLAPGARSSRGTSSTRSRTARTTALSSTRQSAMSPTTHRGGNVNRRILSIAIVAGALAAAAGATFALRASSSNEQPPAALQRARVASDALPAAALAAASQRELATAQSRMIATDTYLVPTQSASDLCLVSLLGNEMRATCNPESRFFNGR